MRHLIAAAGLPVSLSERAGLAAVAGPGRVGGVVVAETVLVRVLCVPAGGLRAAAGPSGSLPRAVPGRGVLRLSALPGEAGREMAACAAAAALRLCHRSLHSVLSSVTDSYLTVERAWEM